MIVFNGVGKQYQTGVVALQNVNVHIQPGEFVFLVGPTGSGKSTFLRLVQRIEQPSSGRVIVDGRMSRGSASPKSRCSGAGSASSSKSSSSSAIVRWPTTSRSRCA